MDVNSEDNEALVFRPSQASWALVKFVSEPPALLARAFVYALLFVAPVALLGTYFFKVQISPSLPGVVVSRTPAIRILAPVDALVTGVHVRTNQIIHVGQPLYSYAQLAPGRRPASIAEQKYSSPVEGTVIGVEVADRIPVRGGDVTVTLLPTSTSLEVEFEISNQMLDSVHEDMEVELVTPDVRSGERVNAGIIREMQPMERAQGGEYAPSFRVRVALKSEMPLGTRVGQGLQVRFGSRQERLITLILNKIMAKDISEI